MDAQGQELANNQQETQTQGQNDNNSQVQGQDTNELISQIVNSEAFKNSLNGATYSILKEQLKENGVKDNKQVGEAINKFNEKKNEQEQLNTSALQDLQKSNSDLQNQLNLMQAAMNQKEITNAAQLVAMELGLTKEQIPRITKMCDFNKALQKDGSVKSEIIKDEINALFNDFPQLKPQENTQQQFFMGADVNAIGNNTPNNLQSNVNKKSWNKFNH